MRGIGDNNGPPLDDGPPDPPRLAADAACCRCAHWTAPSAREESDYYAYKIGIERRPVKEPRGSCLRVQHRPGGPLAFSATVARGSCFSYEPKPVTPTDPPTRGFVTIWRGDKILWQGTEGEEPAEFRQEELDL